jgi:cytochrome c biogenesis protein CcdA
LSTILALLLQEWDVGEVEMDRTFTKSFDLPAPAAKVIINCPCFTTKLSDGDRKIEVTLSTKGLIGANVKAVQSVAADGTIHVIPIRFDVTTTKAGGTPQLSLLYESMADAADLLRLYELSQKRSCSFEVRMASRAGVKVDGLELRDGERVWRGREAVRQALLKLRADAGMVEPGAPPPPLPTGGPGGIDVYFFYSRSCGECPRMIERELPAAIAKRPGTRLVLMEVSGDSANLQRLVAVLQKVQQKENTLPGILIGDRYLGGFEAVRRDLDGALAAATTTAKPVEGDLRAALANYRLPAILLAGLLDGLNPCAFATAVLLASFLAARGRKTVDILLAGAAFTAAVFVTYLAIGFFLLRLATAITGTAVNIATAVVAGALALVSLRDAIVYAKTKNPSKLALQMPEAVKLQVHAAMGRMRLALMAGAMTAGVLVTLLEAICTGQVYYPVIAALARESSRAAWLLVAYGLAFIVPLIVVLIAAIAGVKSPRLVEWSRRNVVAAKIAIAVVLAAMAVWLIA